VATTEPGWQVEAFRRGKLTASDVEALVAAARRERYWRDRAEEIAGERDMMRFQIALAERLTPGLSDVMHLVEPDAKRWRVLPPLDFAGFWVQVWVCALLWHFYGDEDTKRYVWLREHAHGYLPPALDTPPRE